jgi:hypothetical protein
METSACKLLQPQALLILPTNTNIFTVHAFQTKTKLSSISIMDGQPQIDLDKLSLADRQELNQFLQNETQKSTIQQSKTQYIFCF